MKLLIVTQKVDSSDSNLGFFTRWITEFSKHCEKVTVICLEKGAYDFSQNVQVLSLGKENKKASRFSYSFRFLKLIWKERHNYDAVFVHMNPEYVLLGGVLWKLLRKRAVLWYVHKQVNVKLRLAEKLVDKILTASKESFRLASRNIEVVGHGIDIKTIPSQSTKNTGLHLVTVGRISLTKNLRTLLSGFLELRKSVPDAQFTVIGEAITESDLKYSEDLQNDFVQAKFLGAIPQSNIYKDHQYTVFVHASNTGSMDKAVLEALSAGLPVFTSSEAFSADIPGITKFEAGNVTDLADKVLRAFKGGKLVIGGEGRSYVEENHSLNRLIPRILISLS